MAKKAAKKAEVACKECAKIKDWSFDENVVAFCPVAQGYVKADGSCDKGEKKEG